MRSFWPYEQKVSTGSAESTGDVVFCLFVGGRGEDLLSRATSPYPGLRSVQPAAGRAGAAAMGRGLAPPNKKAPRRGEGPPEPERSEEHTSELQSREK